MTRRGSPPLPDGSSCQSFALVWTKRASSGARVASRSVVCRSARLLRVHFAVPCCDANRISLRTSTAVGSSPPTSCRRRTRLTTLCQGSTPFQGGGPDPTFAPAVCHRAAARIQTLSMYKAGLPIDKGSLAALAAAAAVAANGVSFGAAERREGSVAVASTRTVVGWVRSKFVSMRSVSVDKFRALCIAHPRAGPAGTIDVIHCDYS